VLRAQSGVGPEAPLVGIVGRLVPIKDIPAFLRAAAIVAESFPAVRFAIVGDGDERQDLERQTAALGLGTRVFFHGWRRDMAEVYGDLDVVVNCSLNEGTPVALIEALAAGRPVVATRVGGNADLLHDGAHGLLVPAADAAQLARAILEVLRNPAPADVRAQAGREYVLRKHSVGRLVDDVDALYRELLAAPGAAA
jgi:glycosyltransferase involved in cell wall biosynthesis